jgi:hypothetical protein
MDVCVCVCLGARVKLTAELEEDWVEEEREERPAEQSKSYVDTAYPHCIECEMVFCLKKNYRSNRTEMFRFNKQQKEFE